jgi:hypothetical protein
MDGGMRGLWDCWLELGVLWCLFGCMFPSIRREETDGSVERRAKEPVMPMRLFTHRTNVSAYFVGLCHRLVYMGLVYYLPRISSSKPVLTQCTFKQ